MLFRSRWADETFRINRQRNNYACLIRRAGFDIAEMAKKIQEFYLKNYACANMDRIINNKAGGVF